MEVVDRWKASNGQDSCRDLHDRNRTGLDILILYKNAYIQNTRLNDREYVNEFEVILVCYVEKSTYVSND